eukprot:gene8961-13463_t
MFNILLACDIGISCNTAVQASRGSFTLITDRKDIVRRYLSEHGAVDLI